MERWNEKWTELNLTMYLDTCMHMPTDFPLHSFVPQLPFSY